MTRTSLDLYHLVGIRQFQELAIARQRYFGCTPIGSICRPRSFGRSLLDVWYTDTYLNEAAHYAWLAATLPVCLAFVVTTATFGAVLVAQVLLSVYPIILQRYNRKRLHRIRERIRVGRAH